MRFQILKIILWPSKADAAPRTVDLRLGMVNVISGASKTGKSAIIPIIDYCLGADRCAIPVETIRNSCSWFGLLVETAEGQKLLARREPGDQKSTGDMYIAEGSTIEIPAGSPDKNTTAEAVKARLDDLAGLSRLSFDSAKTSSAFKLRPSFRDMMAFSFQPQNIIANPDVLFFKADTYEHREKLKTIFPYALNAITPQVMAAQHELEQVRRELARKQRELENIRAVSERWLAEIHAWAIRARELGLIPVGSPIPAHGDRSRLIDLLRHAVAERRELRQPDADGIDQAVQELVDLQEEESEVDQKLQTLRRRFAEMQKLKQNVDGFRSALGSQRDRLAVASWLQSLSDSDHSCPVCHHSLDGTSEQLDELVQALGQVERDAARAGSAVTSFDREMVRVREEIQLCIEKLRGIAVRKAEVDARSDKARAISFRESEVSRFVGRVEQGLEIHESLGVDSDLSSEVEELGRREAALARIVAEGDVQRRQKRALDKISRFAGRLLPELDAERPEDPIELSITDLTLKILRDSRDDHLWEIGSGANWLSYHVAVSVALQQFGSSAESVGGFDLCKEATVDFLRYDSGVQWGRGERKAALAV